VGGGKKGKGRKGEGKEKKEKRSPIEGKSETQRE
jgi:hypothetical protein